MNSGHYDIVIIGGGPVGMALALGLQDTGISSLLLEARGLPETVQDPRPLALSYGSQLILHQLNVWNRLPQKTPIDTIHISNRGSFGQTLITTEDAEVPALGYVVNYHELFGTMHKLMIENEFNYIAGATVTQLDTTDKAGIVSFDYQGKTVQVSAQLLILADGGQLAQQLPGILLIYCALTNASEIFSTLLGISTRLSLIAASSPGFSSALSARVIRGMRELGSEMSRYVTGVTLHVDGGLHLHRGHPQTVADDVRFGTICGEMGLVTLKDGCR